MQTAKVLGPRSVEHEPVSPPAAAQRSGRAIRPPFAQMPVATAALSADPAPQPMPAAPRNAISAGRSPDGRSILPDAERVRQPTPEEHAARMANESYKAFTVEQLRAMKLEDLPAHFDTPEKVAYLLDKITTYKNDGCEQQWSSVEYFATPQEFWSKKSGDCEDFAIFAKHILDQVGYSTVLFNIWRKEGSSRSGHTVLAIPAGGAWDVQTNQSYVKARATDSYGVAEAALADVSGSIPSWDTASVWRRESSARTSDGRNGWRETATAPNPVKRDTPPAERPAGQAAPQPAAPRLICG